jgi:hypothetical protein
MRAPEMRNKYNFIITLSIFILLLTRISTMVYLAYNENEDYIRHHEEEIFWDYLFFQEPFDLVNLAICS